MATPLHRSARPVLLLAALGLGACAKESTPPASTSAAPCAGARFAPGRLGVQCRQLLDAEGRVVFFHGVNARVNGVFDVSFADNRTALEPIPDFTIDDARRMRAMGFNALRLPINWSGLEPTEAGGFDEAYLAKVLAAIDLAAQAGVRVLVDFHQDAYSKEIGEDGAPLWAIVPAPTHLLGGPLDNLTARRISGVVLSAFDTFFGNTADGARLRDRFAKAVAHVAGKLAGDDRVLGIEIMNEPVPSSQAQLDRLHDTVITAVRAVDPGRVLLFEPNTLRNTTDRAALASRAPWPGTAYAPHVYTLAFSGSAEERAAMTKQTLLPSNQSAADEAKSWDAPLVITEFGYDPKGVQADSYATWQTELQDQFQASSFYWVWKEESQGSWGLFDYDAATKTWTERDAPRKALARPAVEAVAGWPSAFGYDRAAKRLQVAFTGDAKVTAPNEIYVPAAADFAPAFDVSCDGKAVTAGRDEATGIVQVPCGGSGQHTLVLSGR